MMSSVDLALISVRVLSIYQLIQGLSVFPQIIGIGNADPGNVTLQLGLFNIVAAIVLWLAACQIANAIVKAENRTTSATTSINIQSIQHFIIAFVGLILMVNSIPEFVFYLTMYISISHTEALSESVPSFLGSISSAVTKIGLGAGLLFYANQIVEKIQKIQETLRTK